MESFARGLAVIRAFEGGRPEMTIADAARITGLSRAAVRRCFHTLITLGYASVENGTYALTPQVLTLGYAYLGSAPLARYAQPILERASEQLHESCSMSVLDGADIVYVARAATRRILSVGLSVGSRLPAYCTSMGRVLLAGMAPAQLAEYFARLKMVAHTKYTITSVTALRAEIERVRTSGYALTHQELEIGLQSIAVPLRKPDGRVVAAINSGVQATRVDRKTMARDFLPVLRGAADEIAVAIAHGMR